MANKQRKTTKEKVLAGYIAERVTARRHVLQWSIAELARRSQVDQASIRRIEQGERTPRMDTLSFLIIAMGSQLIDFLPILAQAPMRVVPATGEVLGKTRDEYPPPLYGDEGSRR